MKAARFLLEDQGFDEIVVEDFLEGEEVLLLAFCDGVTAKGMPAAQVCNVSSPSLCLSPSPHLPLPLLLLLPLCRTTSACSTATRRMGNYAPTPPENTPSAWSREGKRGLGQRQLIHQQRLYHALCHHQHLHRRGTNQRHGNEGADGGRELEGGCSLYRGKVKTKVSDQSLLIL